MGDTTGQTSQRFQLLGLVKLRLKFTLPGDVFSHSLNMIIAVEAARDTHQNVAAIFAFPENLFAGQDALRDDL